ncbi:hypothetical protein [Ornithinimicrobium kibberense]|uniref:hypothetical protein n=1 Tax=Ornithinimicrobium kibberense TaxID=282060 RepID=UPI003615269D
MPWATPAPACSSSPNASSCPTSPAPSTRATSAGSSWPRGRQATCAGMPTRSSPGGCAAAGGGRRR